MKLDRLLDDLLGSRGHVRVLRALHSPAGRHACIFEKRDSSFEEAHEAVAAERYHACLLNAIHAAISAADAVTVVLAGRRSADPDHQRAADLLEEMGASTPGRGGTTATAAGAGGILFLGPLLMIHLEFRTKPRKRVALVTPRQKANCR